MTPNEGRDRMILVSPLVPGAADTIEVGYNRPGVYLIHCHVVSHADANMISLLTIEE
jgi:FtsP/CotA-like multicopper oxidase with cupredoxin domain